MPQADLLLNIAAMALAGRANGPRPGLDDLDDEAPLESLPIDPAPWFGGMITAEVTMLDGSTALAPFYYWATRERIIAVDPMLDSPDSPEPPCSAEQAMYGPTFGTPRRPAHITVAHSTLAKALRISSESKIGELAEIAIAPTPETDAMAEALLAGAPPSVKPPGRRAPSRRA